MDWAMAIERNREALSAILAALIALLDGAAERVPRAFHRAVTRVLFPAESAVRRLIVIAARGLEAKPGRPQSMTKVLAGRSGQERLAFRLFDRRKNIAALTRKSGPGLEPRIHVMSSDPRVAALWPKPAPSAVPIAIPDDGLIAVRRLRLRLDAAVHALGDLSRQARRLARLRAKREQTPRLRHLSPLRPGPPPGNRRKRVHSVDFVLAECHALAHDALKPDTS